MLTFSLCFLSLFLFSTWYQSHFLVAFTRQNPAFLRCYGFTVSSPRSQTLSPFLPSSESSSPSFCLTQNNLHWIDLIKICPLRPKSAGSSPARAPTRRQKFLALQPRAHAPPRATRSFWLSCHARTRSHALPRASRANVSIYYRLIIGLLGFRPNILVLHILVPHSLLCLYKGSSVYLFIH